MPLSPRRRGELRVRAPHSLVARHVLLPVGAYIRTTETGGGPLLLAAALALAWVNSPWGHTYHQLWETRLRLDLGFTVLEGDLREWVDRALLPLFFFVMGMEIKWELMRGHLSHWRRAALPVVAALGGMAVPIAIYLGLTWGSPGWRGWGIPMATDVAFALGVLALFGDRIPGELKALVLAFAVLDDLGGVLAIAFFYAGGVDWGVLAATVAAVGLLAVLLRIGLHLRTVFVALGVLVWLGFWKSGVNVTIAGVVLGFLVPVRFLFEHREFLGHCEDLLDRFRTAREEEEATRVEDPSAEQLARRQQARNEQDTVLGQIGELALLTESAAERLIRMIGPWVTYAVLPVFALANTGLELDWDAVRRTAGNPVTWAVIAALVVGKPVGIFGAGWLAVKLRLASLPSGLRWSDLLAMGLVAGIGFTVSLFIAQLAFQGGPATAAAKVGVLAASMAAGGLGVLFLLRLPPRAASPSGSDGKS